MTPAKAIEVTLPNGGNSKRPRRNSTTARGRGEAVTWASLAYRLTTGLRGAFQALGVFLMRRADPAVRQSCGENPTPIRAPGARAPKRKENR